MACPCYKEDDHAGEDIINDIKSLCKKVFGKKEKTTTDALADSATQHEASNPFLRVRSPCEG